MNEIANNETAAGGQNASTVLRMPAQGEAPAAKREVVKLTMPAMTIDTED